MLLSRTGLVIAKKVAHRTQRTRLMRTEAKCQLVSLEMFPMTPDSTKLVGETWTRMWKPRMSLIGRVRRRCKRLEFEDILS